jgi:hypothetical protein
MYDLDKLEGLDKQQRNALLKGRSVHIPVSSATTLRLNDLLELFPAGYVDASEVLLASPFELNKAFKASSDIDIPRIVHDISAAISAKSELASSLVTLDPDNVEDNAAVEVPEGWIGTGDQEVDRLLGGGIRRGLLTEVAGER